MDISFFELSRCQYRSSINEATKMKRQRKADEHNCNNRNGNRPTIKGPTIRKYFFFFIDSESKRNEKMWKKKIISHPINNNNEMNKMKRYNNKRNG